MPTITKSIGTSSRDYSTITSWEADLDNGAVYASGDTARGECYDDSAFNASVIINGGGTVGLVATTLTVASGERHDGTAGTGARNVSVTTEKTFSITGHATIFRLIEWLEIHSNNLSFDAASVVTNGASAGHAGGGLRYLIIHNRLQTSGSNAFGIGSNAFGTTAYNVRCIIYRIYRNSSFGGCGGMSGNQDVVRNCTVHDCINIFNGNGTGYVSGSKTNCIGTNMGGGSCITGTQTATCASSDATATAFPSITTADQYVSIVVGSEDLHLKAGADCIDVGTDTGTTHGANIDIDGRDVDAEGDIWDIGADEYVAAGPSYIVGTGLLESPKLKRPSLVG